MIQLLVSGVAANGRLLAPRSLPDASLALELPLRMLGTKFLTRSAAESASGLLRRRVVLRKGSLRGAPSPSVKGSGMAGSRVLLRALGLPKRGMVSRSDGVVGGGEGPEGVSVVLWWCGIANGLTPVTYSGGVEALLAEGLLGLPREVARL